MRLKRLSDKTAKILNLAIIKELNASRLYTQVANQCNNLGLFGAEKFFQSEAADELKHYQRLADYMLDRGVVPDMPALEAVTVAVSDIGDALLEGLKAETALETLYAGWYTEILPSDPVTAQFLLQYLEIQQKSVGEYGDLIIRCELMGDDVLIFDQELGNL